MVINKKPELLNRVFAGRESSEEKQIVKELSSKETSDKVYRCIVPPVPRENSLERVKNWYNR